MISLSTTAALLAAVTTVNVLLRTLFQAYMPGLRSIPGPIWSKFSAIPRLALVWEGNAHERYQNLHDQYGPIVRTAPNAVDVSDPAIIPVIYGINTKFLKSDFYCSFVALYKSLPMENMFSTRDPALHRDLKRSVTSKYSLSSLKQLEPLVDQCTAIFLSSMTDLASQPFDFGEWLQWHAFDVIGMITFSKRFGFMEQRKDVNDAIKGIEFGGKYGTLVGQVPWAHAWLLGSPTVSKVLNWLTPNQKEDARVMMERMTLDAIKASDELKARHHAAGEEDTTEDFLTYLRREEVKNGARMSEVEMVNNLTVNLLAGSDTTAISLRAIFYHLIKNPRTYARLQRELDAADTLDQLSEFITYDESLQLKYLHACIKEALRLHPAVAMPLERIVPPTGAQLGDSSHFLPGGTIVGMNPYVVNRDKGIFGLDAEVFRPERWLERPSVPSADGDARNGEDASEEYADEGNTKETLLRMDKTLLTFGAGSRYCIGKNISLLEMAKFVPQVLRRFELRWAGGKGKEEWEVETFWFAKQKGMGVVFVPRS